MDRKTMIQELTNRGYKVTENDVIKNGVTFHGITLDTGTSVKPTLYYEHYKDDEDAIDHICKAFDNTVKNMPKFDAKLIGSQEYILDHIYIGFQRSEDKENIVKKPSELEGIEEYLYVVVDDANSGVGSYKVRSEILKNADITVDEAFRKAYENTSTTTVIKGMSQIMRELMGKVPECLIPDDDMMYVLSSKNSFKGAACYTDKTSLRKFADQIGTHKLFVIPSSIHEMILVPCIDDRMSLDDVTKMVKEVNGSQVSPEEQLSDQAYFVEV